MSILDICRPARSVLGADGVGGHSEGDVASARVVNLLGEISEEVAAVGAAGGGPHRLHAAQQLLLEQGRGRVPQVTLATTVVVLMLHEDHFAFLWAGDSRGYLLRDGTLHRLTSDHSVVQELVDSGDHGRRGRDPSAGQRDHRAIGAGGPELLIDKALGAAQPEDRFLLCSDGLYKALGVDEMVEIWPRTGRRQQMLVAAALARRARDNITAVVVTAF